MGMEAVKVFRIFKIQTDYVIYHWRPEIALKRKERERYLSGIVVTGDKTIEKEQKEKTASYFYLKRELGNIWNMSPVSLKTIIIRALWTMPKDSSFSLKKSDLKSIFEPMEQAVLHVAARLWERF